MIFAETNLIPQQLSHHQTRTIASTQKQRRAIESYGQEITRSKRAQRRKIILYVGVELSGFLAEDSTQHY